MMHQVLANLQLFRPPLLAGVVMQRATLEEALGYKRRSRR